MLKIKVIKVEKNELFVSKYGMVRHHHKLECHAEKMGCCQGQGHYECHVGGLSCCAHENVLMFLCVCMYVRLCVGVYMYAGITHTFSLVCVHACMCAFFLLVVIF